MRTTLTIDDRVLAAARSRAQRRHISIGAALSELALIGYESEAATARNHRGSPCFPGSPAM